MTLHTTLIAAALCATVSTPVFAFNARLESDASDAVKERLSSASAILAAQRDGITATSDIIAAVQSDYRTLLGTLYRSGYYAPVIRISVDGREGSTLSLITLPKSVEDVVISVDTGAKFTFGATKVAPLAPQTELPEGFSTGLTAKSGNISLAKNSAVDAWRAASYPKAALSSQSIVADHNAKTLDVALGIAPGPEAVFGQLSFAGTKRVSQERLTEITGGIEGKAFNPETLETAAARLRKTGAFRSVAISEADTLNADGSLDITATVTDAAPRRVGFGAEIDSVEGGTLSAYFMHRNISGNADRLRFDAEVSGLGLDSGVDYTLSTTYRRPATTRPVLALVAEAEIARTDESSYLSNSATFSVGAEVTLSDTTYFTSGIGYRYSDDSDDLGDRTFSHFIVPITGARDSRNNTLNPTTGTYFEAEIMPFIGFSGSTTGGRLFADTRAYKGFADDRFVFAGRFMIGSIVGSDVSDTPPDLLFYSGGGGTVRGQPYQSLYVDLDDDTTTGGASFIGLSTELRAGITDKVSLVGFADVGGIGENATPDDTMNWHAGAGLGLRYDTGFGPVRLDIAAPVSGDTGDGVQFYVGIGQAF
ncbi:BamA/TamA family outer membrane protein [Pacificibacter sp. AS14]|uniref:autotransporter assembly complex protein TamA n=1 Tax=Pacificibacter sp. AS14 TaxID=3135785 RepID=UPI0031808AC0